MLYRVNYGDGRLSEPMPLEDACRRARGAAETAVLDPLLRVIGLTDEAGRLGSLAAATRDEATVIDG